MVIRSSILQWAKGARLAAAVAISAAISQSRPGLAEETPSPPTNGASRPAGCTTSVPCAPQCEPGPYRMRPLHELPGMPYTFDPSQAMQPQDGQMFNPQATTPQASASTAAVGQGGFAPGMIGDFFGGATNSQSFVVIARQVAVASGDFTGVPITGLPATDGVLGTPAVIYSTTQSSAQEIFRAGVFSGVPTGLTTADSTVTTGISGLQMKALSDAGFNAGQPFYLAPVAPPPGSYGADVNNVFVTLTGSSTGTTVYNPSDSGIITQTVDPLDPDMGDDWDALYFYSYGYLVDAPSPSAGGSVGRMKISENTSPVPRDRVFFNYSYFNGVPLSANGVDVNRFTPGFEKTFFGGMSSFELRAPFASTLSNTIYADGVTNDNSTQFGNLTMYLKQLVYTSEALAVSGGLGIAVPTASDVNVQTVAGQQLVSIENESVHLLPFIGSLYAPNDRLFVQQFLQFDFDTNGNPVQIAGPTGGLTYAGRAQDTTFLFYSVSAGYWMYVNPDRFITRVAPMVELHYNRSLQDTDVISSNGFQVGSFSNNIELLNGTIGLTALMGENKTLTAGYSTPLGGGADQQFNGEFRLMFNWFFGATPNRFSRVQF